MVAAIVVLAVAAYCFAAGITFAIASAKTDWDDFGCALASMAWPLMLPALLGAFAVVWIRERVEARRRRIPEARAVRR